MDTRSTALTNNDKYVNDLLHQSQDSKGKLLRSKLLIGLCDIINNPKTKPDSLAVLVEYIHNASILHDDVIDNNTTRRGKSSFNILKDNKTAILAGDYLLAHTIMEATAFDDINIIKSLSNCVLSMTKGELIQSKLKSFEIETYTEVIANKTGSLFGTCFELAGLLTNQSVEIVDKLKNIGLGIGKIYQMLDDIEDLLQEPEETSDLHCKVVTLPIILVHTMATKSEKKILQRYYISKKMNKGDYVFIKDVCNKYDNKAISKKYMNHEIQEVVTQITSLSYGTKILALLQSIHKFV